MFALNTDGKLGKKISLTSVSQHVIKLPIFQSFSGRPLYQNYELMARVNC
ncbi:hypothetical protein SGADD02_01367 [Streptococcus gallolyticus]|uniref:Uncharacterized protein n=1 Tax=Streptococcus gallolyticus TaxID=315405 RepID=A0A139MVI6_9STRE|nr:hypothetical protein SGADD02_01367 [Streptococcus gallolyticus]